MFSACWLIRSPGILFPGKIVRARPVGVAGGRVIDASAGQAGLQIGGRRSICAEIACADIGCRDRVVANCALSLAGGVPAAEEEQLVLDDRSAEGYAVVVVNAERFIHPRLLEEVSGLEVLVIVEFERTSMEVVRTRLGDDRDRRAAGHALLGVGRRVVTFTVSTISSGNNVTGMVRQPEIHAGRAVDAGDVVIPRSYR